MAIGYLNVAIIGRSDGRSAVGAAAYASRVDLVDERTGTAYRYARKSSDLVSSFVWLPKGAPDRLRDRATLWNEVEKAETRKNSQVARRIILALPHELTAKQQEQLLQDFVRENFTRKGLAVDANIHAPDAAGDERNHHAHLLIPTRFMDKDGLGKKDRISNDKATGLEAWRESWTKLANRQLERYGHAARISFEVAEGQTPQNHMGPEATALERQGVETRAGDDRLEIVNDNRQGRGVANDLGQDWATSARLAEVAAQRRELLNSQAAERTTYESHGAEMADRHAATWGEAVHRHAVEMAEAHSLAPASYQPGTMAEAEQAASWGLSFVVGVAASVLDSFLSLASPSRRPTRQGREPERPKKRETERREQVKRDQHQQEMTAIAVQQTHERESYERRHATMLQDQQRARDHFEQNYADPSALQQAFEIHGGSSYRADIERMAARKEARQERERGGPEIEGPELKP